ncbi:MAG TPA: thioredoxin family protein [Pirellulaceae bacterium]|nr:thioredoxin family protein [Pirellulaceae bacterium]
MLTIGGSLAVGQSISWRMSMDAAVEESQKTLRPVWIHIGAEWCQPCRSLETFVFKNPTLIQTINANVIPVKAEFDHSTALIERFQVDSIPFDILLSSNGEVLARRRSPHTIDEYIALLTPQKSLGQALSSEPSSARSEADLLDKNSPVNSLRNAASGQKFVNPFADASNDRFVGFGSNEESRRDDVSPASTFSAPPTTPPAAGLPVGTPAGNSPGSFRPSEFALDGDCPVTLLLENRWIAGDPKYGCRHRGKTYLFASEAFLEKFLHDPDRFSPLLAGFDPVLYHEQGHLIQGDKSNGLFMHQNGVPQIVLFRDSETRERFRAQPELYVEAIRQAMRLADSAGQ